MRADTTKVASGCATCKARKIRCDRGLPTCQKCASSKRKCKGYGMRLSWPKDNDKKRALVDASLPSGFRGGYQANLEFLNTTCWDVEAFRYLSLQASTRPSRETHPFPTILVQPTSKVKDMDLVHYFYHVAHISLISFHPTTGLIRDLLLRMALAPDAYAGQALLYAVLALSSLHRGGRPRETMQFKVAALHALTTSAKGRTLSSADAAHHVAACMLLGTFEILSSSESSGEWLWYISGAMDVINGTGLENQSCRSDIGDLLDWVYYHNSISRFAMHHWRAGSRPLEAPGTNKLGLRRVLSPVTKDKPTLRSPNPTHTIINLLSETCDTLLDPADPRTDNVEYRNRLKSLENSIRNIPDTATPSLSDEDGLYLTTSEKVFQMSTLIYLVRASQRPGEPYVNLDSLVDEAFAVPIKDHSCAHFFPLFILACEASTDERRRAILGLIDRTENGDRARSLNGLRAQIEAVWAQQDLYADSEVLINYRGLMNSVISSNRTLPSYV